MAKWADRVKENTATTGTGTVSLGGAVAGFRTFASSLNSGDSFSYLIEDINNAWEMGKATYTAGSPGTITRTLDKSSTGSLLVLSGIATIELTIAADDANFLLAAALVF